MIGSNLRHLRVFLAVADTRSVTQAADRSLVSQPAVTQALAKLELEAGAPLFLRLPNGFYLTDMGRCLEARVRRAMGMLDVALADISARLVLTATRAQLVSLVAAHEAQNFSLAARQLGVAQPTVHRAISLLEKEAGRSLFQRSPVGITPTRLCTQLVRTTRLALVELDQARVELAELQGQEVGKIVIGAMPLSRSHVLPKALALFRQSRPNITVDVLDGPYDTLLSGLRIGDIDFLIGAMRDPLPIDDVVQETLFDDTLVMLAGAGHPLLGRPVDLAELADYPWLVARQGTPTRAQFETLFASQDKALPPGLIETGSVILMREMVQDGHHLACISGSQAMPELTRGFVHALDYDWPESRRHIGLTYRKDWRPTAAQDQFLQALRQVSNA